MPRAAPTGVTEDHSFISNQDLAGILDRIAELLELREANPFRVGRYRGAALEIRALPYPVWRLREEGGRGSLQDIPGWEKASPPYWTRCSTRGAPACSSDSKRRRRPRSPSGGCLASGPPWRRASTTSWACTRWRISSKRRTTGASPVFAAWARRPPRAFGTRSRGLSGGRRAAARPTSAPPGTPSHYGRAAALGGRGVPGAGGSGRPSADRAPTIQHRGRALASDPARRAGRLGPDRPLLQHGVAPTSWGAPRTGW